jgi:TonB family protein
MVLGKPRFSRLPNGQYEITITKPGFKRTVQDVNFVCAKSRADAKVQVEIRPGAATESVVASTQLIAAGARAGVTTVIGNSTGCSQPPPPPLAIAPPNMPITGGVLNGKARSLPKPDYPPIARSARASGTVAVQVVINEEGDVISAYAVSGHPLLRAVSVKAAHGAKFSPTRLSGQAVKVAGIITYNFVAQ